MRFFAILPTSVGRALPCTPIILLLLLLLASSAFGQTYRIAATITITNAPTTNGQTLTVNSSTRTWTNNPALNPAVYIQTNATKNGSATNLFQHVATYRFSSSINSLMTETNAIRIQGAIGGALTVTVSGEWASVTMSTQLVSTPFTVPVRVPLDIETPTNATNIASMLFDGLNRLSTNRQLHRAHGTNWNSTNQTLVNPILSGATFAAQRFSNTLFSVNATNRVDGDWSWTMATLSTLTNASLDETNLVTGTNVFVKMPLTNTYTIRGISGGRDGLMKLFWNPSGFSLIFTNESAAAPAASRLFTLIGTNVIVTNGLALALYDGASNRWAVVGLGGASGSGGGGGSVLTGNALWVSKTGSDSTGTRGDASKPFLTLTAAKDAASAGDTIFVYPGAYNENKLHKNGINYHFHKGSTIYHSDGLFFRDTNTSPVTNIVVGGVFYSTNGAFAEINTNSFLQVEDAQIRGYMGIQLVNASVAPKLVLKGVDFATTNECVGIYEDTALVTVENSRLEILGSSWFHTPVFLSAAGNTNLVLRDCVLVQPTGTAASNSVHHGGAGVSFRVYGTVIATLTNSINSTILTPVSLFQADVDVNR